jgi:P4 family phage/plasmid primase-like protien
MKANSKVANSQKRLQQPPPSPLDAVAQLCQLLGKDATLIPIKRGQKNPVDKGWQATTVERMSEPQYLQRLLKGNIGVLQGKPSNGHCSIDIDNDADAEKFLDLNPQLKTTLQSRGARGRNIWVRITGEYPALTKLFHDEVRGDPGEPKPWGEWRSTGGQTVIYGKHPSGCDYQILNEAKPVEIRFDSIVWPNDLNLPWDFTLYNQLVAEQGKPYGLSRKGAISLNDNFFTAKFAVEHPIVHEPAERQFYRYDDMRGLWVQQTVDTMKLRIAEDLKSYANSQHQSQIERKRTNPYLNNLADLIRAYTQKLDIFQRNKNVIHVRNGMLHLETNPPELREFSPNYYSRNQCPIELVEGADCPRFKSELLASALDPDDISLLQRWCGALLLTGNSAQRIMLLTGTAGGGKSTLLEIIEKIIGLENVTELRTEQLSERFELFRYLGKTFLTGKDVPAEFLMRKGASTIKKLVGHDFLTAEGKNLNGEFDMRGEFNVAITCNSRLRVRLEGDADAWRRRLMIIDYTRPKPEKRISEFASVLGTEEGSGILMWMVRGGILHLKELKEHGDFILTKAQLDRVETLLAESDSVREFVKRCVRVSERSDSVTVEELVQAYRGFCSASDFHPVSPLEVEKQLPNLMEDIHGSSKRNDIRSEEGTRRGFKGVQIDWTYVS